MARKSKQTTELDMTDLKKSKALPVNPLLAEDVNQEAAGAEYRSRCGGALRAAREKLGLTTQEIANRLRLSGKQIEALEADNFAALPEATIVKGFIRNYAKLLKIDAEPLLDAYNVIVPSKAPQSFALKPNIDMKVSEYQKPNLGRLVLFGLVAVLGFGAWLFYQSYVQKPNPIKPIAELKQPSVAEPLPEIALPAAERPAETVTQITLPGAEANSNATNTVTAPQVPVVPAAPVSSVPPPAVQPPVPQQAPSQTESGQFETTIGMTKLEFSASQETWVSVTDAGGKEVYNKTLFAGNRETISAKSPLSITVGNSLGTTLLVNGKPLDLAPHTRTNVAHVKID